MNAFKQLPCWLILLISVTLPTALRADTCQVTLRLTDSASGLTLPGVISVRNASAELVAVEGLLPRGLGQAEYEVRALSGIETEQTTIKLDLRRKQALDERVAAALAR